MVDAQSEGSTKGDRQTQSSAFVLFRQQSNASKEELSYNEAALRILTFSSSPSDISSDPLSDISAFCSRWVKSLEKRRTEHESGESMSPETGFIDVIVSGKRRYGVRGFVLAPEEQKQYLFVLERTSLESAHLEILFRHHNLNNREKEIVRLLLAGNGNKEIADSLGLTLNTVKSYMKILTRKLGVSGRSGIVAAFVAKK